MGGYLNDFNHHSSFTTDLKQSAFLFKGQQVGNRVFADIYEEARESVPKVQKLGDEILADLKASHPGVFNGVEFNNGPLKTLERASDKINGDYNGDYTQICDLARGRILVDTVEQIEILRNYLQDNAEKLGIQEYKDRFAKPSDTGFRDINMKMRLDNGHVIEFRVEHRAMMKAAEATHDPYEEVQKIERLAKEEGRHMTEYELDERQKFMDEVRDIHNSPVKDAGLDKLLSDAGRDKINGFEKERQNPHLSADVIDYKVNTANMGKTLQKMYHASRENIDISTMSETTKDLYALRNRPQLFEQHYIALNQIDAIGSVKKDMAQIKLPKTEAPIVPLQQENSKTSLSLDKDPQRPLPLFKREVRSLSMG